MPPISEIKEDSEASSFCLNKADGWCTCFVISRVFIRFKNFTDMDGLMFQFFLMDDGKQETKTSRNSSQQN